jgi:hypothetical protein
MQSQKEYLILGIGRKPEIEKKSILFNILGGFNNLFRRAKELWPKGYLQYIYQSPTASSA